MAVAIRTATRIVDQDDVNVTTGAGVDEYALCWDNDTAKFVLRQVAGVYLLATGATTGATAQAQTFTNGIIGPSWKPAADSTTALQLQTSGGANVLNVDTTNSRVGINTTTPAFSLDVSGAATIGDGRGCALWLRGGEYYAGVKSETILYFGYFTDTGPLWKVTADTTNVDLDFQRSFGSYLSTLFLQRSTGRVGIGTTSPATQLHVTSTTATTNAVRNIFTLGANVTSPGAGAPGLGAAVLFTAKSTTTVDTTLARVQALWYEATHATFKGDLVLTAYDAGGEREGLRIRGAGSAPAIGFYGVAPIERAVLATGAGASVDNVITALQNLGLVKQS